MLPNKLVFAMILSVWGKHLQFAQLFLETTEVDHTANDALQQLKVCEKIPMNTSARDELERLRTTTIDLFNLNENFTSKILEPLEPLEEAYVPWLQLALNFLKNPFMEESQLVDIYQQFLNNKHVRGLSDMDIATLQTEWNEMDLNQRSKDAREQLLSLKGVVTDSLPHQVDASLLSRRSADQNSIHKLLTQQVQIGQLRLETTEVGNLVHEIMAELTATTGIRMTLKTQTKIHQVRLDVIELVQMRDEFLAKTKDYYDLVPVADSLALWVHVLQSSQQNTELNDEDLDDFAQPLLNNENVQKFMRLDARELQAEWKQMNLSQQLKGYNDTLSDLVANLSKETRAELDVLSTLVAKEKRLADLVEQCLVVMKMLKEVGTTFADDMPKYLQNDIKIQPILNRLQSIEEEYKVYQPKLMAAFKTSGKAVNLVAENGAAKLVENGRLLSDESFQNAYEIDVETLEMEWEQMDLIQRAKNYLAEWKAVEAPGGRAYERGSEL